MTVAPASTPRAILSAVPFVGPLLAFYNSCEITSEVRSALGMSEPEFHRIIRDPEGRARVLLQSNEWRGNGISICKKGFFYATCGMAGSIFSVIGTVSLIALEILSFWPAVFLALSYSLLVGSFGILGGKLRGLEDGIVGVGTLRNVPAPA